MPGIPPPPKRGVPASPVASPSKPSSTPRPPIITTQRSSGGAACPSPPASHGGAASPRAPPSPTGSAASTEPGDRSWAAPPSPRTGATRAAVPASHSRVARVPGSPVMAVPRKPGAGSAPPRASSSGRARADSGAASPTLGPRRTSRAGSDNGSVRSTGSNREQLNGSPGAKLTSSFSQHLNAGYGPPSPALDGRSRAGSSGSEFSLASSTATPGKKSKKSKKEKKSKKAPTAPLHIPRPGHAPVQAVKPIEAMEASSVPKPAGPPPTAAQRAAANAEAKAAAAAAVQEAEDARREEARFDAAQRLMKRRTSLRMSMVAMGSPGGKPSSSSLAASAPQPDVIAEESEVDEGSESEEERAATPLPEATGPPPTSPSSPRPAPREAPEHHGSDSLSPLVPVSARAGSPAVRRRQSVVHQGAGSRVAAYIQHYNMRSAGSTGEKVPRRATISRDALASSGDFALSLPPDMPSLEEFRLQRVATLTTSNFSTASMEPEDWPIAVAPEQLALYSRQVTLQLSPSKAVEEIPSTASPQRPSSPIAAPQEPEEGHGQPLDEVVEEEVAEEDEELPKEPVYELPPPPVVVPKRTSDERAAMMREWYEQRHRPLHATLQGISDNKPLAQPLPAPEPSAPAPRRAVRYMELEPVDDAPVHQTEALAADQAAEVDEAEQAVRTAVAEPSATLEEARDGSVVEPSEVLYEEYQGDDDVPAQLEQVHNEASVLHEVVADALLHPAADGNCGEQEDNYHEQSHAEHLEPVPDDCESDGVLGAEEQRAADDHMAWIESALRSVGPQDQAHTQDSVEHAGYMQGASDESAAPAAPMETQLDTELPEADMTPAQDQQPELVPAPQAAPELQPAVAEIEHVICWPSSLPAAAEPACVPAAPPAQMRRRHRASLFEPGSGAEQGSHIVRQPAAVGHPWQRVVVLPDLARRREAQWPSSQAMQPVAAAAAAAAAAVSPSTSQESDHVGYLQRFDLAADTAHTEQAACLVPDVHTSAHLAPTPHRRSPPLQTHNTVISAVQPAAMGEVPARRAAAFPAVSLPEQQPLQPSQPAGNCATPSTEAEGTKLGTAVMRRLSGAHSLRAESKDSARAAFEPTTARSGSSRRSCHAGMGSDPLGMSAVQARAGQHTQHVPEAARNAPAGPRAGLSAFTPRALPSVRSPRAHQHMSRSVDENTASQALPAPPSGSIASAAGPVANSGHMAAIAVANLHRAVALLGASKSACQVPDNPSQSNVARGVAPLEVQPAAPPAGRHSTRTSHHWPAERFERLPASAWSSYKLAASHVPQHSPVLQSSAEPVVSAVDLDAARTARIAAVAQHLAAHTK